MLLSAVFLDLYGVVDRKCIRRIYGARSIEMEPMMKIPAILTMESVLHVRKEYNSSKIDWCMGYL